MGTLDPSAVFDTRAAREHPWTWAGIHALFVALAGAAGVTAWGLNERVRDRMREVQRQLELALDLTHAIADALVQPPRGHAGGAREGHEEGMDAGPGPRVLAGRAGVEHRAGVKR